MKSPFIPFFALVVAVISVQFGAANAKQLFPIAGAIGITFLRLSLAATLLFMAWRPWRARFNLTQIKAVVLYGLALGFMNLTFYLAIERIPLGLAVAIEFLGPLTIAVVSSRRKIDLLWATLAAVGIVLISPITNSSNIDTVGVAFALIAAVCWALYIFCGQRVGRLMHEGLATTMGIAIGALVVLPFMIFSHSYENMSASILPRALIVAVFSSAIPFSLEMFALKRMSKTSFGILMSMEPAMAALMGFIMLHEHLSIMDELAIGFIIVASLGTTITRSVKPVVDKTLA